MPTCLLVEGPDCRWTSACAAVRLSDILFYAVVSIATNLK